MVTFFHKARWLSRHSAASLTGSFQNRLSCPKFPIDFSLSKHFSSFCHDPPSSVIDASPSLRTSNFSSSSRGDKKFRGGGNRIFFLGSGIGTDSSMIAANDRFFKSNLQNSTQQLSICTPSRSLSSTSKDESKGGEGSQMEDEYGEMTSDGSTYTHPEPFQLESGQVLPVAELTYNTYGELNEAKDNALIVCHALTGNSSLHTWWGDMLGPGCAFDTEKYFVVCTNILGSCYGSTGPTSPSDGKPGGSPYGYAFPDITVQDTVRLQLNLLRSELGISSVKAVIGGSFGGMQAVEFAAQAGISENGNSPYVRSVIPIACGAAHTAWQIAISEVQRQAIYADPKWNNGDIDWDDPPHAGLSVARQMGMVTYRTAIGYETKFGRAIKNKDDNATDNPAYGGSNAYWDVKSYLEYQGEKFLTRFDPVTYVKLTEQMDTHDVGRNRGGAQKALESVNIPILVLGIDSDVLYPLYEQEALVKLFPRGELRIINSDAGHDGFLLEQDQVSELISDFLDSHD